MCLFAMCMHKVIFRRVKADTCCHRMDRTVLLSKQIAEPSEKKANSVQILYVLHISDARPSLICLVPCRTVKLQWLTKIEDVF